MATPTMSAKPALESPDDPAEDDPRVAAFCSPDHGGLFHAFDYANQVWRHDPFDVDSIHAGPRVPPDRQPRVRAGGVTGGRISCCWARTDAARPT